MAEFGRHEAGAGISELRCQSKALFAAGAQGGQSHSTEDRAVLSCSSAEREDAWSSVVHQRRASL